MKLAIVVILAFIGLCFSHLGGQPTQYQKENTACKGHGGYLKTTPHYHGGQTIWCKDGCQYIFTDYLRRADDGR